MKTIKLINLFVLLIVSSVSFSQNGSVKGRVMDGNFPLPGATVHIQGTQKGTTTDFDGYFTLTGINQDDQALVVSYIGYQKQSTTLNFGSQKVLDLGNITLTPEASQLEEVVVQGTASRRLSEAKALNLQKNALSIKSVIASDGIGKLPDRNAAEAVQRVPGVSIERDQGEGRYVAVRGLPSEWNATTMNGNRIPTGADEGGSRATAFDFFPTEMIGYVEVSKALTPDMDADGIGGSVNFITKTAPSKFTVDATLGTGYNEKSGKGIYSGNVTIGNKSDSGKTGFILSVSQWNRNWASDNFEARRSGDYGVYRLELRDYVGERKTTGVNGAFEFNPSKRDKIYTKINYGKLLDTEIHYKHRVRFDKFNETTETGRVELQNIYNDLIFEFIGAELGGKHLGNHGVFDWSLATYRNEFSYGNIPDRNNNSYYVVKFNQNDVGFNADLIEDRGVGPRAYWDSDGGAMNYFSNMFDVYSDPNFQMDPTKMVFADLELYKVGVMERDNVIASANYELTANDQLKLKFGAKFRDKDRKAVFADEFYGWSGNNASPTLADYREFNIEQPGRLDYLNELNTSGKSFNQVLSTEGMIQFYKDNFFNGNLSLLEDDSELLRNGGGLGRNFNINEQHASVYGMATYSFSDKLTLLGGLRATNTRSIIDGYQFDVTPENPDGILRKVSQTKSYLSLLPMLHLKYVPNEKTNLRFAVTRTFARPEFAYMAPGGTYIAADNEFKGGNPDLNPTYSLNFDLMGEFYLGKLDVITAGVFYKSISDPIFNDTQQGTINGISGVEISRPRNGDNAWLMGAEISANKKFDFLPGFLNGFGMQANYTFTKSEFTIPGREGTTRLPRQGDHLINAQLYYEKGRFNIRGAYNFKGAYITDHGSGPKRDDIYYGDYSALDANASFRISDHFTIFAEINNILNEPLEYYYGDSSRPRQVEFHGLRGQAGIKWSL
ncbi:TonB-dependent receptor [Zhouia amylolytica]|uniref:TonB-dependent receptor n=1 Tax=Zhouia amylolytica TaxID=376730 RepID=UPI0020CD2AA0|nr:TonB-dependent receptor [Zhouia amylolytica]MCQ0111437.1 TonB-dependent receptor [Zhouia amylolytica]